MVVELRTGDIWAFPKLLAAHGVPNPIDSKVSKPPTVQPILPGGNPAVRIREQRAFVIIMQEASS